MLNTKGIELLITNVKEGHQKPESFPPTHLNDCVTFSRSSARGIQGTPIFTHPPCAALYTVVNSAISMGTETMDLCDFICVAIGLLANNATSTQCKFG